MGAANPLQDGERALGKGDLEGSRRLFAQVEGLPGKLARARWNLIAGYPERALKEADGPSVAERICRLEAYCDLADYTRARELLRSLEREKFGGFPAPWDFRFFLDRGQLEEWNDHFDLARKNYSEAGRRARTPEQKLLLQDVLCIHRLRQGDLAAATEEMARAEALVEKVTDVWALAKHLTYLAALQSEKGEAAGAVTLSRAAEEIYRGHGALARAAEVVSNSLEYTSEPRNYLRQLELTKKAVKQNLAAHSYPQLSQALRQSVILFFRLPVGRREELKTLFEQALQEAPEGQWKELMEIYYLDLLNTNATPAADLQSRLRRLASSPHKGIRLTAVRGLAEELSRNGEFEKALQMAGQALAEAKPQMRYDRNWRNAPGPILMTMSGIERARHHYVQALALARRALAAEPDDDWTYWRTEAGYEALMTCLESFDTKNAGVVLTNALADISKLPKGTARAGSLTTIMAALLLNQAVAEDLLDPSELMLREYPDNVKLLLKQCFADPALVEKCLDDYDALSVETARKSPGRRSMPLVYKGVFLEALGRYSEAGSTLKAALEASRESEQVIDHALSQVLLARLALREGHRKEAVDRLLDSAEAANDLNPLMGQFYLLVAASAQRDAGDLEEALANFERAQTLSKDRSWQCAYGRASTLELMGRPAEAMAALAVTESVLKKRGFTQALLRLDLMKARLEAAGGRQQEARARMDRAFKSLLSEGATDSLLEAGKSYGRLLLDAGDKPGALEVTTRVLDRLAQWNEMSYGACRPLFERAVSLALDLGQTDKALHYLELSRSAELVDTVELDELSHQDSETGQLLRDISAIKAKLASLRTNPNAEGAGQLLTQTREEFFAKLHELKARNPDFESLVQVTGSQLSAVQQSLPQDAALLEYFPAPDRLYIFVVTSGELSVHQVVFSRDELDKALAEFRGLLKDPNSDQAKARALSSRLREILIDPCRPRLEGVHRLKIVPTGSLWQLPFAALYDTDGHPLCRRYQVSYLSSSELLKLQQRTQSDFLPQSALLIRGSEDLPWSAKEVEELSKLLPQARVLDPGTVDLQSLEAALKGCDLLHIASHSQVSADPAQCFVKLGKQRLQLDKIYGLALKPDALVVLSSCQSGVSSGPPGRECTSLATAFSVAGASSVVSSLWPVDDRATAEFFESFYRALSQGKSRGQALQAAEMETAQNHPHPYFWAGFSLLGAD